MKRYTATEAAKELGTDAKTLRRFLRATDEFDNAGSGGRYEFSTPDIPLLKASFSRWQSGKGSRKRAVLGDAPGLSHADAKDPAKVRAITEARVDALEAALRERGLHISQMKDRHNFRPVVVSPDFAHAG